MKDLNELRDKVCEGISKCRVTDCETCPYREDVDCLKDGAIIAGAVLRDALRVMEGTDWEETTSSVTGFAGATCP